MKAGLVSLLSNEATISNLVGSRIFLGNAPQKETLPHIKIEQLGNDPLVALDGGSNSFRITDFDIDCRANRSVTAQSIADAVSTFLDDYTGAAGSETIDAVIIGDESDDFLPSASGGDVGIYTVTVDARIMWAP